MVAPRGGTQYLMYSPYDCKPHRNLLPDVARWTMPRILISIRLGQTSMALPMTNSVASLHSTLALGGVGDLPMLLNLDCLVLHCMLELSPALISVCLMMLYGTAS